MKRLHIASVLSMTIIALVAGQALRKDVVEGQQSFAQGQETQQSAINTANQDAFAQNAALNKAASDQAQLNALSGAKKQVSEADRFAAKESIDAQNNLGIEDYKSGARFDNLDAASSVDKTSNFGLSIVDQQSLKEDHAVSSSNGDKFSTGSKLLASEGISAASATQKEAVLDAAAVEQNQINAVESTQDQLQAQEAVKKENSGFLNAANFGQSAFGFNQGAFGGAGSAFNDNSFGGGILGGGILGGGGGFGGGGFGDGGFAFNNGPIGGGLFQGGSFQNGALGGGAFGNSQFGGGLFSNNLGPGIIPAGKGGHAGGAVKKGGKLLR